MGKGQKITALRQGGMLPSLLRRTLDYLNSYNQVSLFR